MEGFHNALGALHKLLCMVVTEPYDWADDPNLSAEETLTRFRTLPLLPIGCGIESQHPLDAGNRQKKQSACDLLDGCQYCGIPFDVIAYRYLCPHCHMKNTCCE